MAKDSEAPTEEGVVKIGKRWEFGTLGEPTDLPGLYKIYYENSKGNTVHVVRDVCDENHWRGGWTILPVDEADVPMTTKTKTPVVKAEAKVKKVVAPKDPNEIVNYVTGATKRGNNKFPADKTHNVCTGPCGLKLIGKKFPTVSGDPEMRVSECRECRDIRRGTKQVKDEAAA